MLPDFAHYFSFRVCDIATVQRGGRSDIACFHRKSNGNPFYLSVFPKAASATNAGHVFGAKKSSIHPGRKRVSCVMTQAQEFFCTPFACLEKILHPMQALFFPTYRICTACSAGSGSQGALFVVWNIAFVRRQWAFKPDQGE